MYIYLSAYTIAVTSFSLLHSQYYSTVSGRDIAHFLFLFNSHLQLHLCRAILLKGLQILQCTKALNFYVLLLKQTELPLMIFLLLLFALYSNIFKAENSCLLAYIMPTLITEHNYQKFCKYSRTTSLPLKVKTVRTSLRWIQKDHIFFSSHFACVCVGCSGISLRLHSQ